MTNALDKPVRSLRRCMTFDVPLVWDVKTGLEIWTLMAEITLVQSSYSADEWIGLVEIWSEDGGDSLRDPVVVSGGENGYDAVVAECEAYASARCREMADFYDTRPVTIAWNNEIEWNPRWRNL